MNKVAVFAIIAVAILAAGVGALALRYLSTGGPASDGSVVYVTIAGSAFSPDVVTVKVGTTVIWTNMDSVGHTVTMGGHDAMGGGMGSNMLGHMGTYRYTFMDPGTYEYHCDPHPSMTGTVVVSP